MKVGLVKSYLFRDAKDLSKLGIRFWPRLSIGQKVGNVAARFERFSQHPNKAFMPLGAYSYSHSVFPASHIGRYCSIAARVTVMGDSHPHTWVTTSPITYKPRRRKSFGITGDNLGLSYDETPKPVTIGNDVWIGSDVLLKDGIHIGDGAVVAAGSVVTKDVAAYTIVGGNPATTIRPRFDDDVIADLMDLQWWQYKYDDLQLLNFSDPKDFVRSFPDTADLEVLPDQRFDIFEHIENIEHIAD